MTEKNYITKAKNQFKSSAYYIFWGTATFAVVAGQLYVGSGYRRMAETSEQISADVSLLIETMLYSRRPTGQSQPRYEPMPLPSPEDYPTNQMPIIQ